jgi:hypothetical protein
MAAPNIIFDEYSPYDNGNSFMDKWYKAVTEGGDHPMVIGRQAVDLTTSPVIAPQKGRGLYCSNRGIPNEWYWEFAERKKTEFEGKLPRLQFLQ